MGLALYIIVYRLQIYESRNLRMGLAMLISVETSLIYESRNLRMGLAYSSFLPTIRNLRK